MTESPLIYIARETYNGEKYLTDQCDVYLPHKIEVSIVRINSGWMIDSNLLMDIVG